jgi:hypothetical protein
MANHGSFGIDMGVFENRGCQKIWLFESEHDENDCLKWI